MMTNRMMTIKHDPFSDHVQNLKITAYEPLFFPLGVNGQV